MSLYLDAAIINFSRLLKGMGFILSKLVILYCSVAIYTYNMSSKLNGYSNYSLPYMYIITSLILEGKIVTHFVSR